MSYGEGGMNGWPAQSAGGLAAASPKPGGLLGLDSASLMAIAMRWKTLIAGAGLLAAIVTFVALLQIPPSYSAKTQVMLDPGAAPVINIPNVVPEANTNVAFTESAVIVMQSSDVLRAVVQELSLDQRKEFNPALQTPGLLDRAKDAARSVLKALMPGRSEPDAGGDALQGAADPLAGTIRGLRKTISVRVLGESQVIEVRALSTSPRLAAAIADALAQKYIDRQLETKYLAGDQATAWLEGRAEELRGVLQGAEQRVADFRKLQIAGGQEMVDELRPQLTELTDGIARLTSEQADLAARRDEIATLYSGSNFVALTKVLGMPIVTDLHLQLSDLDAQILRLQAQFGEHSSVQRLRDTRARIEQRFRAEVEGVLSGLNVRIGILADRRKEIEARLQTARHELADREQAELQLMELEREAQASREVYSRFLLRLKETRERSQFQSADAWIVSAADVPVFPSAPQKGKLSVVAAIGGSALALLLLAFLADNRPRVADPRDVAQMTGVSAVRQIPYLRHADSPLALLESISASPASAEADAMRRLRLSLASKDPRQVNIIMITSAEHGEGKTTLSLSLAETFARDGANTALVSADPSNGSLAELLQQNDPATMGFDVVDLRSFEELHGPEDGFAAMLGTLKRRKVIIIDTPPVLASSDAFEIGLLANKTVVACAWDQTPNEALAQCVGGLREAGVEIGSIAINKVPPRHLSRVDPRPRPIVPPPAAPPRALPPPEAVA